MGDLVWDKICTGVGEVVWLVEGGSLSLSEGVASIAGHTPFEAQAVPTIPVGTAQGVACGMVRAWLVLMM